MLLFVYNQYFSVWKLLCERFCIFFFFFAKLWQNRPRENRSIILCDSFHKTTVFSHAWMLERLVRWESCGGDKCVVLPSEGECVSRREAKQPPPLHHQQRWRWRGLHPAQSLWLLTSVWWGSYRGQRSMEAAFMKERLCVCLTIFCTDGLSYDHWVRVCIPVSVGTVLSPKGQLRVWWDFDIKMCQQYMILSLEPESISHIFVNNYVKGSLTHKATNAIHHLTLWQLN